MAGAVDPKQVLRILGPRAVQKHLVDEVQEVYRSQGVSIHDKHIEVIVRQMLRRVTVIDSGDTELLPGELVERSRFESENRRVVAEGGTPASGRPGADGYHEGVARDGVVAVGGVLPGDDPGAHRGRDRTARATRCSASRRTSSSASSSRPVPVCRATATSGWSRPRRRRPRCTRCRGYEEVDYGHFGVGSGEAVPLEDFDLGRYDR